jgi:Lon protease-like protein
VVDVPKQPVPVFPLPNVVLFPRVIVPLHVFELRYRTLVRDALSGERLIALALLRPGWERDEASPALHPVGCLARFEEVEWLPDDHYDLKVLGLERVRLERAAREFPYRAMRVSLLPQAPYSEDDPLVGVERRALLDAWRRLAGEASDRLPFLTGGADTYEALVNAVGTTLPAPVHERQEWLELDSVIERGHRVREWIERALREPPAVRPPGGEWN